MNFAHHFFRGNWRLRGCLLFLVSAAVALSVASGRTRGADDAERPNANAKLRYGWQRGQEYHYEVRIEAELPDRTITNSGNGVYQVQSSGGGRTVLSFSGTLSSDEARNESGPGIGRNRIGRPRGLTNQLPSSTAQELTLDAQGKMAKQSGESPLPYLLGDFSTLAIEPLPERSQSKWDLNQPILITESIAEDPFTRMHAFQRGGRQPSNTQRSGEQKLTYRVISTSKDEIKIKKRMQLETKDREKAGAARKQVGEGLLIFDRRRGVFSGADMKLVLTVAENNVSAQVPVHVQFRLLGDEELERRADETKQRRDKFAARRAEENAAAAVPFTDEQAAEVVAALSNPKLFREVAGKLAKKMPDGHQEIIAQALAPGLYASDGGIRSAAAEALKLWASTVTVPALIEVLEEEEDVFIRARIIEALARLKDERGAEAIAAVFFKARGEARRALEEMGPMAEPYVLTLLDDRDENVRSDACRMLAVMGTKKSRERLTAFAEKKRGAESNLARKALVEIGKRE